MVVYYLILECEFEENKILKLLIFCLAFIWNLRIKKIITNARFLIPGERLFKEANGIHKKRRNW